MPMAGNGNSTCKTYPVKRTVRIYQYTLPADAKAVSGEAGFFESFTTSLVKEVSSDKDGFFQAEVPAGKYSVVVMENNRLYSSITDGQGAVNPIEVSSGPQKVDLTISYKATF